MRDLQMHKLIKRIKVPALIFYRDSPRQSRVPFIILVERQRVKKK